MTTDKDDIGMPEWARKLNSRLRSGEVIGYFQEPPTGEKSLEMWNRETADYYARYKQQQTERENPQSPK